LARACGGADGSDHSAAKRGRLGLGLPASCRPCTSAHSCEAQPLLCDVKFHAEASKLRNVNLPHALGRDAGFFGLVFPYAPQDAAQKSTARDGRYAVPPNPPPGSCPPAPTPRLLVRRLTPATCGRRRCSGWFRLFLPCDGRQRRRLQGLPRGPARYSRRMAASEGGLRSPYDSPATPASSRDECELPQAPECRSQPRSSQTWQS